MEQNTKDNYPEVKVILLGDSGVGKTSLINVTMGEKFNPDTKLTITNCSLENLKDFSNLAFKKKVLLLASKVEGIDGIVIKRYSDNNQVVDDTTYYANHTSLKQLINS